MLCGEQGLQLQRLLDAQAGQLVAGLRHLQGAGGIFRAGHRIPEEAHILVTAIYSAGFQFYRYGFSAAFAAVTFVILFAFSVVYIRLTRASQGVYGT